MVKRKRRYPVTRPQYLTDIRVEIWTCAPMPPGKGLRISPCGDIEHSMALSSKIAGGSEDDNLFLEFLAPGAGLEPATISLTGSRTAIVLPRNVLADKVGLEPTWGFRPPVNSRLHCQSATCQCPVARPLRGRSAPGLAQDGQHGAHGRIRTSNPQLRRLVLCPVELRGQVL